MQRKLHRIAFAAALLLATAPAVFAADLDPQSPATDLLRGRVMGPDRKPVAGATVWVVTHRWSARRAKIIYSHMGVPSAVTDAEGRFAFPDLQSAISIHVCHPDFLTWGEHVFDHDMKPDPMPIGLDPGSRIAGRVVDASGAPVSGARVEASPDGRPSVVLNAPCPWGGNHSSALTDAQGSFTLHGLKEGSFVVTAELPGSGSARSLELRTILGSPVEDVRLVLEPKADQARQPVNDDAAMSGPEGFEALVLPPGEEVMLHGTVRGLLPDESALIEAFSPSGTSHEIAVEPDGTWRLEDVPAGHWMLELSTAYARWEERGLLAAGAPEIEVPFELPRLVKVRGRILGPDGKPVPCTEATLISLDNGKESCVEVSWNGWFTGLVEPGLYHLSARASGLSAEVAEAVHAEAEPVEGIEISLERRP